MKFSRSARFEIVRRLLAAVADVFDHLTLVERVQAGTLDRGDMDEYVSAAALRLNESIALRRIEPFHGAVAIMASFACTNVIPAARPSCDRQSEVSVASGEGTPGRCATKQGKARISGLYAVRAGAQPREVIEIKVELP